MQVLLALPTLPLIQSALAQDVNPTTVHYWTDLNNTDSSFQLADGISVSNTYDGADKGTKTIATDRSVEINGGYGANNRYGISGANGAIVRETTINRAFIVDGGTLTLKNINFSDLFEYNSKGKNEIMAKEIMTKATRSSSTGGAGVTLYSTGSSVFSKSENSAINIINCSFTLNSILQDMAWKTTETKTPVYVSGTPVVDGTSVVSGGAIGGDGLFTVLFSSFSKNNAIAVLDQEGTLASAKGGAIRANHLQIGGVDFTENYAKAREALTSGAEVSASGGAIAAEGANTEITVTGSTFTGNYASAISDEGNKSEAKGGALFLNVDGNAPNTIEGNTFTGNYAKALGNYNVQTDGIIVSSIGGAAFFNQEDFVTGCTFTGNHASATVVIPNSVNLEDIDISVQTKAWGGAAYGTNFDTCTFTGNYAEVSAYASNINGIIAPVGEVSALGGALYMTSGIVKNSSFISNYTIEAPVSRGGAIYLAPLEDNFSLDIIASGKQSIFRGNRMNVIAVDQNGFPFGGTSNSIYIDATGISGSASRLDFRATSGFSVQLFDPIVIDAGNANVELSFNRPGTPDSPSYEGAIMFRGDTDLAEYASPDDLISYTSSKVSMHQYGGEVAIMDGAVVGANVQNHDELEIGAQRYVMDKGLLEMTTNGHLMASRMQFGNGEQANASCTFRNGTGARMTANSITINNGLTFDFVPFIDSHDSGTILETATLSLGGNLHIADKSTGYLEFYLNSRWAENQRYLVFHLSDEALAGKSGDFGGILSNLAESNKVPDTYGHKGTWTMEWDGNDLFAVWKADLTPEPPVDPGQPDPPTPQPQINPELAGNIVINSLWSTVSNMEALSGTAFSQIGISRFKLGKDVNFWGSALGDFKNHRSQGRIDGYNYNGFGYSVGTDLLFKESNLVGGVAFGNLFGKNKSRDYNAKIDQTTYIGMFYARWMKEINKENLLNLDGSLSLGTTANKMKTYYSDGMYGCGKWDNDAVRLTLKFSWNHALNQTWTLTPFIGLEYDDASQLEFTESGSRVRNFQKSTLRNLALPAGIAISSQQNCFGSMKWSNSWAVSYIPDVYRKNPASKATLYSQNYTWMARGINPARNAVGAAYDTRLQFNEAWAMFAGYSLEARKNSVYHNANIGFSYSF